MKKRDIATIAMLAISAAILIGTCPGGQPIPAAKNQPQSMMSQSNQDVQAFYNTLSPDAQNKFDQLDDSHKRRALEMASGPNAKDPNKAVELQFSDMQGSRH